MAEEQKAEITSGEDDGDTLERRYRVILDFRLLAREITPEVCAESFFLVMSVPRQVSLTFKRTLRGSGGSTHYCGMTSGCWSSTCSRC